MKFDFDDLKNTLSEVSLVDWIIVGGIAVALLVGILTFAHFRGTADRQIEAQTTIGFQVFLRGVTLTGNTSPINPGEQTFITIRNVPYTNLQVIDAKIDTKKAVMPNPKGGKEPFVLVDDASQAFLYDMIVTLIDKNAKITKDGAVVGGNKIKIGLPVTLEGPSYKLNGTVSDVRVIQPQQQNGQQNLDHDHGHQHTETQTQGQPQPDVNKQEQNMG